MKVLVLGSGAREHAITWKFSNSHRISGLFIAPGNAGTAELGVNLPDVDPCDSQAVLDVCRQVDIDLVFVGPEAPLAAGIVDALQKAGVNVIGPNQKAAQLESSKVFSKRFMIKHGVPTAEAKEFSDKKSFTDYINSVDGKVVVKKSGLAAGKGVLESADKKELLDFGLGFLENDSLIVEEFLEGYEVSVFVISDGKNYVVLPPCTDFKKAGEGDSGPNTGGMGSICPVPWVSADLMKEIEETAVKTTVDGLNKDGINYKGVVYVGLMITDKGPKVLEYNVRFGDPEAQVLLPLIESDFCNFAEAIAQGTLDSFPLSISDQAASGVVVASGGYPGSYKKGMIVEPIPYLPEKENLVFHASTTMDEEGNVYTGGGRCFTAVGFSNDLLHATSKAYEAVKKVSFEGSWYRKDIGKKFFME